MTSHLTSTSALSATLIALLVLAAYLVLAVLFATRHNFGLFVVALGVGVWTYSERILSLQQELQGTVDQLLGGAFFENNVALFEFANRLSPLIAGVGVAVALYVLVRDRRDSDVLHGWVALRDQRELAPSPYTRY